MPWRTQGSAPGEGRVFGFQFSVSGGRVTITFLSKTTLIKKILLKYASIVNRKSLRTVWNQSYTQELFYASYTEN
jgi:hypothetical protein